MTQHEKEIQHILKLSPCITRAGAEHIIKTLQHENN
jgi:hypothetical protein